MGEAGRKSGGIKIVNFIEAARIERPLDKEGDGVWNSQCC